MKIDFVVPWVNDSDLEWRAEKAKYSKAYSETDEDKICRHRDWGILKYWFRAVENNTPWVNRIHFITCGQVPDFLDLSHPKIHFVTHSDYIPEKYLPTFSANPIELNMHRIEGLEEHFVYFNDDMFINKKLKPDYFFRDGKPCHRLIERAYDNRYLQNSYQHMRRNSMAAVNRHFSRMDEFRGGIDKVFNPCYGRSNIRNLLNLRYQKFQQFEDTHVPAGFLKSTLEEVWEKEFNILDSTSMTRFRSEHDVNQYIFKYWDIARGNFAPFVDDGMRYDVNTHNVDACAEDIVSGRFSLLCINDSKFCDDFINIRKKIIDAFEERYPEKSSFEKK